MVLPSELATQADTTRSERQLVESIRACEELKAQAAAVQARLTARLDAVVSEQHAERGVPRSEQGRGVASQVAAARRESPARGSRWLGLARALTDELPFTLAAMEVGALSEWRATLIARETACLARADRAAVDAEIAAPDEHGRFRFDGWGDRRLAAETQRVVARLDPQALVDRRAKAEYERRVSLRPAPDTMTQLSALLPVAQGVAVWATLSRVADQLKAQGDERGRQQIMADTLVERVTGQTTAGAVPITVNLVVSDETLFGGSHEPAWLQGFGPLSAEAAVGLTRRALIEGQAALRRLYARPATGTLVAMESGSRLFPAGLATFVKLRDRSCRTPWCDAPVRHLDHVVAASDAGPTSAANAQGLCEQCNLAKEAVGWRTRPITGPPGSPHRVETTLPTGHVLTSTAPDAPTPSTLHPRSEVEWYLGTLLLAG